MKRSKKEDKDDSEDDAYPATVLEKALDDDDDDEDDDYDDDYEDDAASNIDNENKTGNVADQTSDVECDDNDVMVDMVDTKKMDHNVLKDFKKADKMNLEGKI